MYIRIPVYQLADDQVSGHQVSSDILGQIPLPLVL